VFSIFTLTASETGRVVAVVDRVVDAVVETAGVLRTGAGGGVGTTNTGLGIGFENAELGPAGRTSGLGVKLAPVRRQCDAAGAAGALVVGVELRLAIDDDDSDVTAAGPVGVEAVGGVIDAWLGDRVGPGVPEGLERGEDPISAPELEATLRPVLVELRIAPLGTVEPAREGVEGDLRS